MTRISAAPVRKSIRVDAPPARAFDVFAARFDSWWPRDHHIGKAPMKQAIIEPHTGGRWYEKGEDGSECDWGRVLVWDPPSRLVLSWRLNSKFVLDESVESEVEICFVPDGDAGTRVELEHRISSDDARAIRDAVDSPRGWSGLLEIYAAKAAG
ncbi:MAG TPA: SRPBCC family protein [Rhizomicrobium sp.]|nr:SRPBCC family protein [Rhizomicrobium sp.]